MTRRQPARGTPDGDHGRGGAEAVEVRRAFGHAPSAGPLPASWRQDVHRMHLGQRLSSTAAALHLGAATPPKPRAERLRSLGLCQRRASRSDGTNAATQVAASKPPERAGSGHHSRRGQAWGATRTDIGLNLMNRIHTQTDWTERAKAVLPAAGFGNFDASIVIARGEGSRVWDEDGANTWITSSARGRCSWAMATRR